jgi:predicted naringenin-chalcone synthase
MIPVFINAIAAAVPPHDFHQKFVDMAGGMLPERETGLFARMAARSGISHRWSVLAPSADPARIDTEDFYRRDRFPDTASRMRLFERHAPALAGEAVLGLGEAGRDATHLVVSCCTGFTGPGLDLLLAERLDLAPGVERSMIGFMGCSAALNALKTAWHIVRSDRAARVLVVNLELCTLHFRQAAAIDEMLSYLIFADGCAAALVSAEPHGVEVDGFASRVVPGTQDQITWRIGSDGFVMHLSGALPGTVTQAVSASLPEMLGGLPFGDIRLWAVHPGGRSILDAVARGIGEPVDLSASRAVLRDYGNMSSATVMFVLKRLLEDPDARGEGCLLAFGPGVSVEAARFRKPE